MGCTGKSMKDALYELQHAKKTPSDVEQQKNKPIALGMHC